MGKEANFMLLSLLTFYPMGYGCDLPRFNHSIYSRKGKVLPGLGVYNYIGFCYEMRQKMHGKTQINEIYY